MYVVNSFNVCGKSVSVLLTSTVYTVNPRFTFIRGGRFILSLGCFVFVLYGSFPGLYNSLTGKLPSGFADGSGLVVKVINNSKNPDSVRTDNDLTRKISCLALVDIDHKTTAIPSDRTWLTDIACDVKEGEKLNFAYLTKKAQTFTDVERSKKLTTKTIGS